MKTIIVATNYSDEAANATRFAAELARYTNSRLVLFNSFELSIHSLNTLLPASAVDELFDANRKHLKKIAFEVANTFAIRVESITRLTDMKEELDFQVQRLEADLVVMGMNEERCGYGFDNTTASVIHHAIYPVLAVPAKASFHGISKILYAFDPCEITACSTLPLLQDVATCFNAEVELCHVAKTLSLSGNMNNAGGSTIDIETLLGNVNHCYKSISERDIVKGLTGEAENMHADLLVMVPHKYGFWESIWHKSKTLEMVRRTHLPLLSLPG